MLVFVFLAVIQVVRQENIVLTMNVFPMMILSVVILVHHLNSVVKDALIAVVVFVLIIRMVLVNIVRMIKVAFQDIAMVEDVKKEELNVCWVIRVVLTRALSVLMDDVKFQQKE